MTQDKIYNPFPQFPGESRLLERRAALKLPIKKILLYGGLVLLGIVVIFLVCKIMLNLGSLATGLRGVLSSLRAILLGAVMAYLLYPLTRFAEQYLLYHNVKKKTARGLSTAFATLVLLAVLALFIAVIVPELLENLPELIRSLPGMIQRSFDQLSAFLESHGQDAGMLIDISNRITTAFTNWLQDDPLSTLMDLVTRMVDVARSLLNFAIGIIVMVYLLMSRDQFVGQGKKLLFALVKKRSTCDTILRHLRAINQIFSGFVSGKLLDSLIIGILCSIVLSILNIPYTMLISVIVGITNIIPVFGPFFGAIPSALLLLLTDPGKCLVFIIFIIILQQVDGNIIGPKILGDSTGLSAFWVLFALLLFNHLMGFWGMLLGVPLFASFYYLLREFINARLRKKNLPVATTEYIHIMGIDDNGTVSYADPQVINFRPLIRGEDSLLAQLRQWLAHPTLREKSIPPQENPQDHEDSPDDPT